MKQLWATKDKDGLLRLFEFRPLRIVYAGEWSGGANIMLIHDFLPSLTWENEPLKVWLTTEEPI